MIKLLYLLWIFFKIGLFTIGGGYAMIPMIESEIISKGWVTTEELANFLAISESTPGPFAINMATFIGASQCGFLGALFATVGVILPSFIIILIVYQIYDKFIKNRYVDGAMRGVKAIVIGLIASVAFKLIYKELFKIGFDITAFNFKGFDWKALVIMVLLGGSFFIFKKKTSPILMILISSGLGILLYGVFK